MANGDKTLVEYVSFILREVTVRAETGPGAVGLVRGTPDGPVRNGPKRGGVGEKPDAGI